MARAVLFGVAGFGALGVSAGVAAGFGWVGATAGFGVALAALAGVFATVGVASSRPDLEWFGPAVCRGRHGGRAALTLDDGPDPTSTLPMLEALAARGLRATFFVLADRVERHPELLRAMVAGGHEIGLHGLGHHPWLTMRSPAAGAAELVRAVGVLRAHGAPAVRWYRPPFGAVSPRVYGAVAAAGLEMAWCSVRTRDGVAIRRDTLRARCRGVVGTDIVLLHEGQPTTIELFREILDEWAARGVHASTLSAALESDA